MHHLALATEQAWSAVDRLLSALTDDEWEQPTPCPAWSVGDIAAHLGHLEGLLTHGFPQPEPPTGFQAEGPPLDQFTGMGVAARRAWTRAEVMDELRRAAAATGVLLSSPDLDWDAEVLTPIGPAPRTVAVELRVTDVFVHLCDLRAALNRPLETNEGGEAQAAAAARAVRLTPWAWAKRVGAGEGERLRLELWGPGGTDSEVVIRAGRAVTEPVTGQPGAAISGSALAYLLAATGRPTLAEAAGGLHVEGETAHLLLERFRLVG